MRLNELEIQIKNCKNCELWKSRINPVIGGGNINSNIMLVGEAPGAQEDIQGKVFVGPSGMLLDKMLTAIGLDRTKVYITNILKCRPPNNRNPLVGEKNACLEYLRQQFKIMRPSIIVLLGSVACKAILSQDFSIMRSHGKIIKKKGVIFIPTFHPSALLRDESKKPLAWHDLQVLQTLIQSTNL